MKRFMYACLAKRFGETFDDAIVVDESTVELKMFNPTNWRKGDQPLLRAAGGKLGQNTMQVHFFVGISRKGLTSLLEGQCIARIC